MNCGAVSVETEKHVFTEMTPETVYIWMIINLIFQEIKSLKI